MLDKLLGFLGLPSPATLLGVVVALCAVTGWSYHLGDADGFNRAEALRAAAQDKALDALSAQLTAARESAMAAAAAQATATAIADAAKANLSVALRSLRDEKNKPAASCVSDPWRLRVNAAVSAANAPVAGTGATGSVYLPVPAPADTWGRLKRLGGGLGGSSGGVPSAP